MQNIRVFIILVIVPFMSAFLGMSLVKLSDKFELQECKQELYEAQVLLEASEILFTNQQD